MKRIMARRGIVGVIAVVLFFSLTLLSTNSSVYAASSTAEVTHVEVNANGEVIKLLKKENFTYPVGAEFYNYMSTFDEYIRSGMRSSSISIGGIERVVAEVEWKKLEAKEEQRREGIPYDTKEKEDATLDYGEKVVEQMGVAGEKLVTYKVIYLAEVENSREIITEEVITEPVEEIVRVGTKITEVKKEEATEVIPYETKEKEDATLDYGEKVVEQAGVVGEKTIIYNVTYVNGEEVAREIESEEVTVAPVDEVILIGTKITEVKEEQRKEEIPYETIEQGDTTLDYGEKVVGQVGVVGEKIIIYNVTYVNGEEVSREIGSEEVTVTPVDEIILIGMKGVEIKEEQTTEKIPFETKEQEDPSLDYGQKVIEQAGVAGEKTIIYNVTYVNGEEVSRDIESEEVTVAPVDEVILIGTKVTEVKEEQKTEEIPYETKEQEDPTLNLGEKVVEQVGVVGEKTVTYKITYVNGVEESREVIVEEITVEPKEEIIRIGTKINEPSKDPVDNDDESDKEITKNNTDKNENTNGLGEKLPKTATNTFNIGLVGLALLFAGILMTLFRRFKENKA